MSKKSSPRPHGPPCVRNVYLKLNSADNCSFYIYSTCIYVSESKKGGCCPWVAPVELTPASNWPATLASLCSDQHAPGRRRGSPVRDHGRVRRRRLRDDGVLTNRHSLPKVQGTSSEWVNTPTARRGATDIIKGHRCDYILEMSVKWCH